MQTLEGHAQNISCVGFHPELPIILTGSEDGMWQVFLILILILFFFVFWGVTHYLKGKPYFFPLFFSVQGTCTLYVITSRMYSGPQQQNKYYCIDELSCLEGLPYSNLWNVAFDLELAEVLAIIIVIPAMEIICTLMQHNCINCYCNWSIIFLCIVGTVRIWQANTYRLESTLNYGLERVWSMAMLKGSNNVALGYDEGSILIKVCWLKLLLLFSCIHCTFLWQSPP